MKHDREMSASLLHAEVIRAKPFLKKLYADYYRQFHAAFEPKQGQVCIELGSGGGFIKEIMPAVITSDVMPLSRLDVSFSALQIPLQDNAVDAFFMFDVMHHVRQISRFFGELNRTLKIGGKVVMIEPANTPWSRFIYKHFHPEPFDTAGGWHVGGDSPLYDANGALPWIVFCRDRRRFQDEYPSLKIVRLKPHTPFRYLISGGVSSCQLLPGWTYSACKLIEDVMTPLHGFMGMFMTVELQKVH
jgi:SAM-dependent methyltransferase